MTLQPASSKRCDHSMLFDSSKRARSSNSAVTCLPDSAAAMSASARCDWRARRYNVILMEMTVGSAAASRSSCTNASMDS